MAIRAFVRAGRDGPALPEASQGSCIVLGTVEVLNGKVTHVCNCPRTYVWSFANFVQVLLATLIGGLACEDKDKTRATLNTGQGNTLDLPPNSDPAGAVNTATPSDTATPRDPKKHVEGHSCCREFELDCDFLLKLLDVNPRSPMFASTASLDAVNEVMQSFTKSMNFTEMRTFSPRIFENMQEEQARAAAETLGLNIEVTQQRDFHPIDILTMAGLAKVETTVALSQEAGVIRAAHADHSRAVSISDDLRLQVERAEKTAQDLEARLATREKELEELKATMAAAEKAISEIQTRIPTTPPPVNINEAIENAEGGGVVVAEGGEAPKVEGGVAPKAEGGEAPKVVRGRRRGKKEEKP
jgi:hypothetical protein